MGLKKILLVDDDPTILEFMSDIFEDVDCEVYFAHNGLEATQLLKHHHFQVVVSDIVMPVMTGIELTEKINGETPLILTSGFENNLDPQLHWNTYIDKMDLGTGLLKATEKAIQRHSLGF